MDGRAQAALEAVLLAEPDGALGGGDVLETRGVEVEPGVEDLGLLQRVVGGPLGDRPLDRPERFAGPGHGGPAAGDQRLVPTQQEFGLHLPRGQELVGQRAHLRPDAGALVGLLLEARLAARAQDGEAAEDEDPADTEQRDLSAEVQARAKRNHGHVRRGSGSR